VDKNRNPPQKPFLQRNTWSRFPKFCLFVLNIAFASQVGAESYSVQYEYDELNSLESASYGDGTANFYNYDEVGNLELISLNLQCFDDLLVISDESYLAGETEVCIGLTSITASSNVTVNSGANVQYRAPSVGLGPGFRVSTGGTFSVQDF